MNREDIIRMAREAGIGWGEGLGGMPEFLDRFAALVAAAEREACANVADEYTEIHPQQKHIFEFDRGWIRSAVHIASSIRARGETK